MRALPRLLLALAALLLAAGSVRAQSAASDVDDEDEAPPPPANRPAEQLPEQDLSASLLYQLLLAEIAAQRGNTGLAAQTYVDLAKRTRDPRIARRALEMANAAQLPSLALEAARAWVEADPDSAPALQYLTALLIGARRVAEAEPYLAKLLASDGAAAANGFMQLGRLLAANPDKAANLALVQRLAERYPDLPQAHFAVAQAALAADDEALALQEIRRAAELRPDWELAALLEAQVLQRRSPAAAAQRLADYLARFPDSRDVRLNYARVLVADRRLAEARAEFEKLLAANPGNTDVIYAVGVLAAQLKDYPTAEANLKRLLEMGYRDANSVRLALGQIAEEQKDWARAIEWYQQVTGEQRFVATLRAAGAMAKQGRVEDALARVRGAEAASPQQQVQRVIFEAQLLRDSSRNRDALDLLSRALEVQPEQPELLYDHALTAEKLERFDVLEANLRKLIQMQPEHAHAYNALGYSLADRNQRLPEARKLIERALELAPEDLFIVDSMGWVLYRQGDLKGAAEQLRRAWTGRPDGEIGAHLGEVLWVMGDRAEAQRVWREALQNSPENETLQKTIKRFTQ